MPAPLSLHTRTLTDSRTALVLAAPPCFTMAIEDFNRDVCNNDVHTDIPAKLSNTGNIGLKAFSGQ